MTGFLWPVYWLIILEIVFLTFAVTGVVLIYSFTLDFMRNIVKNKIFKIKEKSTSCQICINILFTLFCLPICAAPFVFKFVSTHWLYLYFGEGIGQQIGIPVPTPGPSSGPRLSTSGSGALSVI